MKKMSVNGITVCGVCVSMAFVLSYVKFMTLPLGGAVTLCSMLFITIIGYIYGPKYGFMAAFVYSFLEFVQDPYFFTPVQFLLDYILAFTVLGVSGFFKDKKFGLQIGYLAAITGRFIFATLSGFIFFSEYAPEGWNPLLYTICYNGSYIYAEGIVTLIIISLPVSRKAIEKIREETIEKID